MNNIEKEDRSASQRKALIVMFCGFFLSQVVVCEGPDEGEVEAGPGEPFCGKAVSYTHLDVYKRQAHIIG